ncbi:MAG: mannose-1-phosphate guanylyltransferase [Lentimicrobium sp.]|nr:mannose-1-phosphate guanylyltransferase [Lentimicrobium sp.]
MAGGVGARFWPMSRQNHPKQFIDILGNGETLIQSTFRRFSKICPPENIYIVTNEIYKAQVLQQLPVVEDQVLCEPSRRNTAPCIAYANYRILQLNPDANIVVAPSDHIILKEDNFTEVIKSALKASEENDWLLTLGIRPSRPDTGYGYIQYDYSYDHDDDHIVKKVKTFTEKPQIEMARQFLASGDFLWNSGIFIWRLKTILSAFNEHIPEVDQLFRAGIGKYATPDEDAFIRQTYAMCKSISIDYGVMEKAENVYVMASDFGWSDLGTWGSLYETRQKDEAGNAVVGQHVMLYESRNCIVNVPKDKLVVLHGLDGYIVVEDNGILLVCRKGDEQQIRQFVNDVLIEKGEKYI